MHVLLIIGAFLTSTAAVAYLFWLKSGIFLDPDFGWQIRTGSFLLEKLQNGNVWVWPFPKTDPFSYSMPSFPFVPHSWLSDILFAKLYEGAGWLSGLERVAIVTSIAAATALSITLLPRFRKQPLQATLILFLLSTSSILSYISVRPQAFSWLFFSIFVIIAYEERLWNKMSWILPILMVFWVNIHGGFIMGLGILLYRLLYATFSRTKAPKGILLITLLAFASTFINPYTVNIWREVFSTYFDDKLRSEISEWKPLLLRISEFHIPTLAISLVFILRPLFSKTSSKKEAKKRSKKYLELTILYAILLVDAMNGSKMFPFWLIAATYSTHRAMQTFYNDLPNQLARKRYIMILNLLVILSISTLALHIPRIWSSYQYFDEESYYPKKAVVFLKSELKNGNPHVVEEEIFTPFTWGGYMLQKIPEKKVFIDGRMTYWIQEKQPGESVDAFTEQAQLVWGWIDEEAVFDSYNIGTVLIPTTLPNDVFKKFARRLERIGWIKVYQDHNSVIYQRPDSI